MQLGEGLLQEEDGRFALLPGARRADEEGGASLWIVKVPEDNAALEVRWAARTCRLRSGRCPVNGPARHR